MRTSVLAALAAIVCTSPTQSAEPLPALGAALEQTSVSGISSGAFMAGQF
jgi:poly(3-hydroxybutyrate) depolymerase